MEWVVLWWLSGVIFLFAYDYFLCGGVTRFAVVVNPLVGFLGPLLPVGWVLLVGCEKLGKMSTSEWGNKPFLTRKGKQPIRRKRQV